MIKNHKSAVFSIIAWVLICAISIYALVVLANRGGFYFSDFSLWPPPISSQASDIVNDRNISEPVDNISISWIKGNVILKKSEANIIQFVQKYPADFETKFLAEIYVKNKTLTIIDNNNISTVNIFNVGMIKNTFLELYLPEKLYDSIKIDSLSGDLICSGIKSTTLVVNSTTGNTSVDGVFSNAKITATNGDITTNNIFCPILAARSVTGSVKITGSLSDVTVESTNGNIIVSSDIPLKKLMSNSVSADTAVYIPSNNGFTLTFRKISGKFETDFITTKTENGSFVFGDGSAEFNVTEISGNFNIYKK